MIQPPDARVHFARFRASRSCPPFNAYHPRHLDDQLDVAARGFVESEVEGDPRRNVIRLSRIFRVYRGDFGGRRGVIDTSRYYHPVEEVRDWLRAHGSSARFESTGNDWALNSRFDAFAAGLDAQRRRGSKAEWPEEHGQRVPRLVSDERGGGAGDAVGRAG